MNDTVSLQSVPSGAPLSFCASLRLRQHLSTLGAPPPPRWEQVAGPLHLMPINPTFASAPVKWLSRMEGCSLAGSDSADDDLQATSVSSVGRGMDSLVKLLGLDQTDHDADADVVVPPISESALVSPE